jgi:hypothetical protein
MKLERLLATEFTKDTEFKMLFSLSPLWIERRY